jgi:hypothetical protein
MTFRLRLILAAAAALRFLQVGVISAAPIDPHDILVSTMDGGNQNRGTVAEFTTNGTLVQKFFVQSGTGNPFGNPHDIVMDDTGNIQILNGSSPSYLTTLTPTAGMGNATYQSHTLTGWDIYGADFGGGIAFDAGRQAIYATDRSSGTGSPKGIVRFDSVTYSATRPLTSPSTSLTDYVKLALGLDGLMYASYPDGSPAGYKLDVIDPSNFTVLRTVTLPIFSHSFISGDYTGWAVDAVGNIFAVEGEVLDGAISEFNPQGIKINSLTTPYSSLRDLDLTNDGKLLSLSSGGNVVMTDTNLTSYTTFQNSLISPGAFAAWAAPISVPEPTGFALASFGVVILMSFAARHRER